MVVCVKVTCNHTFSGFLTLKSIELGCHMMSPVKAGSNTLDPMLVTMNTNFTVNILFIQSVLIREDTRRKPMYSFYV